MILFSSPDSKFLNFCVKKSYSSMGYLPRKLVPVYHCEFFGSLAMSLESWSRATNEMLLTSQCLNRCVREHRRIPLAFRRSNFLTAFHERGTPNAAFRVSFGVPFDWQNYKILLHSHVNPKICVNRYCCERNDVRRVFFTKNLKILIIYIRFHFITSIYEN